MAALLRQSEAVPMFVKYARIIVDLHENQGIPLSRTPDHIEKHFGVRISENTARGAYRHGKALIESENSDGEVDDNE
jgi:hypothetical protein